jgi:hypothetical protein
MFPKNNTAGSSNKKLPAPNFLPSTNFDPLGYDKPACSQNRNGFGERQKSKIDPCHFG